MDIMRPQLVVIGGRQYRKLATGTLQGDSTTFQSPSDVQDLYPDEDEKDDPQSTEKVEPVDNGYILRLDIPSVFYKYIIGKGGRAKRDIETDTECSIRIPRQGETGLVEIFAKMQSNVSKARTQLELMVETGRRRERFTHFVAILLNGREISQNLKSFREECLSKYNNSVGVCPEVFQVPTKFHLTIGMMKLFSQKEKDKAVKLLEECIQNLVKPLLVSRPLVVGIKGLDIMRDDPKSAHILYAKAHLTDGSNRLQRLIDGVAKEFIEAGLMENSFDRDSVKVHATVMNSKWKGGREGSEGNWRKKRSNEDAFDVRKIISDLRGYSFGEMEISSLHILTRGQYEEDRLYRVLSEAKFV